MATRSISRTDLVGLTTLSFIRAQTLSFSLTGVKPSTRFYAFFDGKSVDKYITPTGGVLGSTITSNNAGTVTGTFTIPPATFNTGNRILRFQDTPIFNTSLTPGSTISSAEAIFGADGLKKTFQETVTTINPVTKTTTSPPTTPRNIPRNPRINNGGLEDPLAQTFFTYGVTGGCFITKLDLYFSSKDPSLPISVEIRDVVNGYPGPNTITSYAKVSLPPSQVVVSTDASIATTFTFSRPIYLEEDREYCFVIKTNTNNYNIWTSVFGEKSIETGKMIFEQPFIGTMFKSENNITWTAEQTEDIKFTLYKAKFDTTEQEITLKANAPLVIIPGSCMSVTMNSSVVTVNLKFQHGFITGSKIVLRGLPSAMYRGISNAILSNSNGYGVIVLDDYSFTFDIGAGTNFTSTGTLTSPGFINRIDVDASGTGYVTSDDISITAPPSGGTQATATAVITDGKITSVIINNAGSGYLSTPAVTITGGTGAILTAIVETMFEVAINRQFQFACPLFYSHQPVGTSITGTLKTTSINNTGSYEISNTSIAQDINVTQNLNKNAIILSTKTESTQLSGSSSTTVGLKLKSDHVNVSPVLNFNEPAVLRVQNALINEYTADRNTSELAATGGTAQARYISKMVSLASVSQGARVFVNAASTASTSFDVFIRTSLASNGVNHRAGGWQKMTCDINRNASSTMSQFKDYEFYLDDITQFDIYDIKIVLYSPVKYLFPIIGNYRCIILAT